jgi:hypothetical protein
MAPVNVVHSKKDFSCINDCYTYRFKEKKDKDASSAGLQKDDP